MSSLPPTKIQRSDADGSGTPGTTIIAPTIRRRSFLQHTNALLLLVLECLWLEELFRISRTCSELRNIVQTYIRGFKTVEFVDKPLLLSLIRECSSENLLTIKGRLVLPSSLFKFKNLEELVLPSSLIKFKKLEELVLRSRDFQGLHDTTLHTICSLKSLKILEIVDGQFIVLDIIRFLENLSTLEVLNLSGCIHPHLKGFTKNFCPQPEWYNICASQLESLRIPLIWTRLGFFDFSLIFDMVPNLLDLEVTSAILEGTRINEGMLSKLKYFSLSRGSLQYGEMREYACLAPDLMKIVNVFEKSLKNLWIEPDFDEKCNEEVLNVIKHKCGHLKRIDLPGWKQESVSAVREALPQVEVHA